MSTLCRPSTSPNASAPAMSWAWCAAHYPASATASCGIFRRTRPSAMTDSCAASLAPATNASNRRRACFPHTSDTTLARVRLVSATILRRGASLGCASAPGRPGCASGHGRHASRAGAQHALRSPHAPAAPPSRRPHARRFLARPLPDLFALGHTHLDHRPQDMRDRLPGDARPLHSHHRALRCLSPGAKSDKVTGGAHTSTSSAVLWPSSLPRRRHAVSCAACPAIPPQTGWITGMGRLSCTWGDQRHGRQCSRLQGRFSHA